MKILYHHRTASKDGQDVHIEEMVSAMRRQGHDVVMVAPAMAEGAAFGDDAGLISRIKKMLPGALYELLELGYSWVAYRKLRDAYAQHRPDVLYERYNLFFLPGLWLKKRTGIPYLLEVNSPLAHERAAYGGLKLKALARWTERSVWRGADMTLPVTNVLADFLRRDGVPESRIMVVPNGVNRDRFPADQDGARLREQLGLGGKIVLGFVGFIRDWHGLPHVVDAMAAMENRDQLHFLVVGDGPGRIQLEEHARRLGMAHQVSCLGLVDRDRVAAHVSAFDIALQPKVVAYASPLKLFEYMGLGRAIIAPDQPNIREILTDAQDALLFAPDDTADFRAKIMRLCADAALRQRLGQGAMRTIEAKGLTWDNNARRVLGLVGGLSRQSVDER
jgi:glycosyltransferase involved in cell wall biosynthesis